MHDLRQLRKFSASLCSQIPAVRSLTRLTFQVKLPDYSSREIVRDRLRLAVREGAGGFHLSSSLPRMPLEITLLILSCPRQVDRVRLHLPLPLHRPGCLL